MMQPLLIGLGVVAGVVIVIVLLGDRLFPAKHVYTEIDIAPPPEAVWAVLADIGHYPAWNPYHVRVTGVLKPGEKLTVEIHKPNGEETVIRPHVMRLVPNRELTWGGGIHGLFFGEHVFLLEGAAGNGTHLIHKESFTGLAVQFASLEAIDEGYALMNEALRSHVEGNAG